MLIYSCIFVVPVVATVYEDEVAADLGEVAVMSCMVAGEPIYNAYWKDVNHDRIYTSWHYEVSLVKGDSRENMLVLHANSKSTDQPAHTPDLGLDATKPVFRVSNKASFKTDSSATESI